MTAAVYLLTEVEFSTTPSPAHIVKNLIENEESSATVAHLVVTYRLESLLTLTGILKPATLISNHPPIVVPHCREPNRDLLRGIELITMLHCID